MPKSHRDLLKRQLAHCYNNLMLAGGHLQQVIDEFKPVHPELSAPLEAIQDGIILQINLLHHFVFDVWGVMDPAWDSWRNVPDKNKGEKDNG